MFGLVLDFFTDLTQIVNEPFLRPFRRSNPPNKIIDLTGNLWIRWLLAIKLTDLRGIRAIDAYQSPKTDGKRQVALSNNCF